MRVVLVALVAALALCAADPRRCRAEEAKSTPQSRARELERVWRDEGAPAFRKAARESADVDPFEVLIAFLENARVRNVALATDDRAMLEQYGGPDAGGALAPGVKAAVEGWLAASPAAFDAEAALQRAVTESGSQTGDRSAELKRLQEIDRASLEDPLSLWGPIVRLRTAQIAAELKDHREALSIVAALRDTARSRGWPLLEAATLCVAAESLRLTNRPGDALVKRREEAAIRATAGDPGLYVEAEHLRAKLAIQMGGYREAETAAKSQLAAADKANLAVAAVDARMNLAIAKSRQGRFEETEGLLREVLRTAPVQKLARLELHAMTELSFVLVNTGRIAEALALVEEALARPEGKDWPLHILGVRTQRAQALIRLHRRDDAMRDLEAALVLSAGATSSGYRASVLVLMARIEEDRGLVDVAKKRLEECLAIHEASGDRASAAVVTCQMSGICARSDDAKGALHWGHRAVLEAKAVGSKERIIAALLQRSAGHRVAGDGASAVADAEEGAALFASLGRADPTFHATVEGYLGLAYSAAGRVAEAIEHLRKQTQSHLATARGLTEDMALGLRSAARTIAEMGTVAAFRLEREDPSRGAEALETAWWFEEAGRTRLLLDAMRSFGARRRETVPEALLANEREALSGLVAAQRALVVATAQAASPAALGPARERLADAHLRLRDVDAKIARSGATRSAFTSTSPVAIGAMRKRLGTDTAILTYSFAGTGVLAVVVTDTGGSLIKLGPAKPIEEMVEAWLEFASTPDGPEAALAERLHAAVLAPVASAIGGRTRLLIVPDGPLAFLPFEALVERVDGKPRRAVERYEIAYQASATAFDLLATSAAARPAGRGVVALGDAIYPRALPAKPFPEGGSVASLRGALDEFAPLPGSGAEARAVASLYPEAERTLLLGEDATVARLLAAAGNPSAPLRALHVACHAFVDPAASRLSGLVLTGSEVLNVETLYRARIAADLAVLSACETAGGKFADGEGVIGLTRGFFVAGVPRVVVSEWRVPDDSTAAFMRAFHARLVKGDRAASALRAAKIAAIGKGGAAAHPYHWAPFVLWGLP